MAKPDPTTGVTPPNAPETAPEAKPAAASFTPPAPPNAPAPPAEAPAASKDKEPESEAGTAEKAEPTEAVAQPKASADENPSHVDLLKAAQQINDRLQRIREEDEPTVDPKKVPKPFHAKQPTDWKPNPPPAKE